MSRAISNNVCWHIGHLVFKSYLKFNKVDLHSGQARASTLDSSLCQPYNAALKCLCSKEQRKTVK